ncbi:helix-turn-helix domain-containing protein [uncultured Robinsoniella sp.]|uniref:helix-turn-helix domain-containing protein n=1 Tax=uncultured Robinsoniella sp. TaxID=904190 RepID=UPI00374ECC80
MTANISTRECSRCFQRCIKLSPMNYLNEHRIRMAAQMLLQTNKSIMTISECCGFSSSSYFGKIFQDYMGCTPKNYRKK